MQHVKISWLRRYNYGLVLATVGLYMSFFTFEWLGVDSSVKASWGITPVILALGAMHAVYVVISDLLSIKKYPWMTSLISFVIYAFLIGLIIKSSGYNNIFYIAFYTTFVSLSGMLGLYAPLTAVIFTWLILIFSATGISTPTATSPVFNVVATSIISISGICGWLFFKKYYLAREEELQLTSKLEEEQFKTSTILESITDGVLVINTRNLIQISNISAAQMLGWTKDEVTSLDFHSLIKPIGEDPEKLEEDAITLAMKKGESTQKISKLETLNNRQVFVDIVASPIFENIQNHNGKIEKKLTGIIAVLRDVDKQKREEQQRSDFISTASHEMRTPVASIQGYLELALNPKISQVDEKTKTYLDKAYEATKHLGQLFQDLLTVSQTEDGRIVNHPTNIEISALLKDIYQGQLQPAARKGLELKYDLGGAVGNEKIVKPLLYVNADSERLREVIMNLVENAIKYTPKGTITVSAELKADSVLVSVSDTGPGIAEEDITHLFQKFYRVDNTATREIGGTGLGLYISKQIIELLGGKIWVESKLGQGSTFIIELPRVDPSQMASKAQEPTPPQAV